MIIGFNKTHSYYFRHVFIALFQQHINESKLMQFKLTPSVIIGAKDFLKRVHATCDKERKVQKVKAKLDTDG